MPREISRRCGAMLANVSVDAFHTSLLPLIVFESTPAQLHALHAFDFVRWPRARPERPRS